MSARSIVYKYPGEVIEVPYDFAEDLPASETASSLAVTAVNSANETAGSGQTDTSMTFTSALSGNVATVTVTGGTNFQDYTLTLALTTSASNILQHKVELRVRTNIKQ